MAPVKVYFGTVVRMAPLSLGGELARLDWDSRRVEARVPVVPRGVEHDPNPRGNTRGCRGIQVQGGRVLAASYHGVEVLDRDLNHERTLTHGLMVGLHEIHLAGDGRLWVASTAIDAALRFDLESGELLGAFWPREMPKVARELRLEPAAIDKGADNRLRFLNQSRGKGPSHLHLNAVAEWDGRVLALFHAQGVIADLTADRILVRDPGLRKGHNLVVRPDGTALVNDSLHATVRAYDLRSARPLWAMDLKRFAWVRELRRRGVVNLLRRVLTDPLGARRSFAARPLFLRGMDLLDGRLFLGLSPAAVVCVDSESRRLVDGWRYSTDLRVCVHGLDVAP